jgi:signal transduction histidine kinase
VHRWLRSLHAQLLLWAVLPLTFIVVALAFTGVYTHQREMRDFVARRDLATARLAARTVEDALAYGIVGLDGQGLTLWLPVVVEGQSGAVIVVDGGGRVLAHPDAARVGDNLVSDPGVAAALQQREGYVIVTGDAAEGLVLIAFAPVGGSDWEVLVREPVEGFIGPILRLSNLAPVVAASAGVLSLLVLIFGWFTIVRPLQRLSRAAGQVSWGDFSAIARPVGGVQEVRDLHQALAEMVERIRGYEAGMRDYLGAVTRGQEGERARLARELHDGPVQGLIALGQRVEMAQRAAERGETDQAQVLLGEARAAQHATVEELRRIIGALRPVYLEDLGFLPALEMLVQQAAARSTVRIRLEREGAPCRFAPDVELAAYRSAQEALSNALQHAQAQNVVVRIRCAADGLTLSVSDDGAGFDLPQRPDLLTQAGHFGLVGLRERAAQLGGDFQVRTVPGAGTQITVCLPGKPLVA